MNTTSANVQIPFLRNWNAQRAGSNYLGAYEFPLCTDAQISGPLQRHVGPYAFLNTMLATTTPGMVQVAIILRISAYIESGAPDFSRTDDTRYHGGDMPDEVAALASLCMGIRMRAGGETRRFAPADPFGIPCKWDQRPTPALGFSTNRLVLPEVVHAGSVDELRRLEQLLFLSDEQSIALVRTARLYQDALWIAESEPALAWLMLVSALETAANQWRAEDGTPAERFAQYKPTLVELLLAQGGQELVDAMALEIEPTLGATKKFIDFTLRFLPEPPPNRPSIGQVPYARKNMKNMLSVIYSYRSKALHGGQPFPAPMCRAPFSLSGEVPMERAAIGDAASTKGGVWQARDVPINLHAFHHIVRGALLNWWESMAEDSKSA